MHQGNLLYCRLDVAAKALSSKMVHPGGLLGCASPCGPLLKQRYPPWYSRLSRRP